MRTFLLPYRRQLATMLVCALLGVTASILIPLVIEAVVDGPIQHGRRGALVPLFFAALALGAAEAGLILVRRYLQSVVVVKVETEIRDRLYGHLQRLPVSFHDRWQTGQLLSRATMDLSTIRRFLGFGAIFLVVNAVQYVAVVTLLIATYAPLGVLVALGTAPVIVISHHFGVRYAQISRRVQDRQGDNATLVEEAATGLRVVKAYGRGPYLAERFATSARELKASSLASVGLRARFHAVLDLIPGLTMAVVVGLGGVAVAHHVMTLGALVAFTVLLVLLQWPVIDLGWILSIAQEAATASDRVWEVFDAPLEVSDRPGAVPLVHPRGELRFDHVSFRYPGAGEPVLRDVDFSLAPGETLALVGATGSGKTTLAGLPIRLHDVTGGRVLLDGVDVRDLTLTSLRSGIAMAFEDPVLFSMSVRENLTLGRPGATDAEIAEALEVAQAGFVTELPHALETRIGEQGLALSGGQRQRLALARAVLARPALLLLDDPLSALDVATEALVEEALRSVLADTTALVVVHRPSTVALADRVALLADGVIAATGTHHELMELPGYADMLAVDPASLAVETGR